jgi:predicted transposase YbfD/YdcC
MTQDHSQTLPRPTVTPAVLDHFSALRDPRQSCKVVFPLPEIMLLVLCGTLVGAEDFVEIEEWGGVNLPFLRTFLPYRDDIPSHDTLNDVINALDPELFKTCFMSWVTSLQAAGAVQPQTGEALLPSALEKEVIAIDGKTSRRSHNRNKGRNPLHVVSAWASRQRLVLGQQATEEKSNEITAIPLLLDRLMLRGALVTIDAMGTQTAIAEKIIERGGDYCLALKENWPVLHADVERYFVEPPKDDVTTLQTVDNVHGRLEIRNHSVCHDVAWLFSDRRYAGEVAFPGLVMIAMVRGMVERHGKIEHGVRYYLCSAKLDVATFARAVRAHWGIENRLHWVLDTIFHDDLARLRTGHGPENMAIVKHMAMNFLRSTTSRSSLKVRRKRAGWDPAYLGDVLSGAG